jgi:2-dehydro-3-deoxy-D-arabinonate dehydratase
MRYYRLPAERGSGTRLVAREGQKAYDLSVTDAGLDSFGDLAAAAAVVGEDADGVASDLTSEAALIDAETVEEEARVPVLAEEIWAAGVTYEVSGDAREAESDEGDLYGDVYGNERPELFLKATPSRTVGPGEAVGIRNDSGWDVPEPELAVVCYRGEIVGYTVGNDASSREIEGSNPLYLPQAKIYENCCAIGPCVASPAAVENPHDLAISMTIERDGGIEFDGETSTTEMVRSCEELVSWFTRHNPVPDLSVVLTGTSLVPEGEFTLQEGDRVAIDIESIGTLSNTIETV